jgi:hemerythrin
MEYFEWSDDLSVNVKEIDGQHKRLVEMVNSLNAAMLARKGREAQKATIDAMVDYAATHFKFEEANMSQFRFPGFEAHRIEHERFTAKAFELKARADRAGFILTLEIVDFLRDWLQNHIRGTDRQYSECFNEHGLH